MEALKSKLLKDKKQARKMVGATINQKEVLI
jgi:hypothetical protein